MDDEVDGAYVRAPTLEDVGRIRLSLAEAGARYLLAPATRTPCSWMALDADDASQLLGATAQGRVLFTFNARGFVQLAPVYPEHGGILLAAQRQWTFSERLRALDRFLSETTGTEVAGQVMWLDRWRARPVG